jgi:hypothetical protein
MYSVENYQQIQDKIVCVKLYDSSFEIKINLIKYFQLT